MNAVVLEIDKPVEIDRKENLRDHRLYPLVFSRDIM